MKDWTEEMLCKKKSLGIEIQLDEAFEGICKILPSKFQEEFKKHAFIAGGAIYSHYNNLEVNDYDFFLDDVHLVNSFIAYFKDYVQDREVGNCLTGMYNRNTICLSKYAISFNEKFQIIIKYIGTPKEVVSEFDFKHNMFSYKYGDKVECFSEWDSLIDNKIHFNEDRARDICGIIMRIPKFKDKGFDISKKEISKMLIKLSENGFDDNEMEILENINTY